MILRLTLMFLLLFSVDSLGAGEPSASGDSAISPVDGAWITELEVDAEARRKVTKNLEFAFRGDWRPEMREVFRPALEAERVLALPSDLDDSEAPGTGDDPSGPEVKDPPEKPVRLRIVLTDSVVRGKDNSNLDSMESWVNVNLTAQLELYLPGKDVPYSTDLIEDTFEARSQTPLHADLYQNAYVGCFHRLAVRAGGKITRRLRPERYEQTPKSKFKPFRPFRPK